MNQAWMVKKLDGWRGDARLYRLVPPLEVINYGTDTIESHEFVVVSAVSLDSLEPETCIFAATEEGVSKDYVELPGGYRGGTDHAVALFAVGYEVAVIGDLGVHRES